MAIYNLSNQPKNVDKLKKDKSKAIGISLIAGSSLCFVALLTNLIQFLKIFIMGMFGYFSFPVAILCFVIGVALVNRKKYVMTPKYIIFLVCAVFSLVSILHLLFVDKSGTIFQYIGRCYSSQNTVGGLIFGVITSLLLFTLNDVGAYILFSASFIVFCGLIADYLYYVGKNAKFNKPISLIEQPPQKIEQPILKEKELKKEISKEKTNIVLGGQKENIEDSAKRKLGLIKSSADDVLPIENKQPKAPERKVIKPENLKEYLLTPQTTVDLSKYTNKNASVNATPSIENVNEQIQQIKNENTTTPMPSKFIHEDSPFIINREQSQNKKSYFEPDIIEQDTQTETPSSSISNGILDQLIKQTKLNIDSKPITPDENSPRRGFRNSGEQKQEQNNAQSSPIKPNKQTRYFAPPIDLLTTESMDLSEISDDIIAKRNQLEVALDTFGIPAKVIEVVVGPAVTRYELEMPVGISVKKILAHDDDIALNLASNGDIRIEAPIPGKSAVGIEVPNNNIATVGLKEIISSDEFKNSKAPLTFAMGKDINGSVRLCNLQKMPHLLIAGATNSGKSVCLNAIILSLIYRLSPEELKLILVDPKRVEFTMYNGLPHLLLPNVVTESDKALNALNWAVNEMERRYALFQKTKTRNYDEYKNCAQVLEGVSEKLPFVVIIIDELADLLMTSKKEVEEKIMRLAQKARAAGIHLILATQRPSVDVITGTIKSNFPSRITFALTSFADSKTILDQSGAEKLLGKGDMLYKPSDAAEPRRIQGCYVTSKEVDDIVEFVKQRNKDFDFDAQIETAILNPPKPEIFDNSFEDSTRSGVDPLFPQVLKYFIEQNQASTSMIQRRFVVGYPKAARIMEQLQDANYISPPDGSKPRTVLITMEQYEQLFGEDK